MNVLFQNGIYYLWLHNVKLDFHTPKGKIYDAINLAEPKKDNTIQQVQLSKMKAIYNKGGNEKEQYVRLHRT